MSTSQQADPLIGRLVDGRYRVRARIARGGMATVYVATDLRLERRIALKVMHGHLSDDSVFQSRFIQEARAAARLADPHVVNVFDQGQDGDMAYLVMEYLPGITLRELMREQRRLNITQTITIMDAVLSGLAAAHRGGIIHRDVKPENVLLAEDGRIKIGDFGLARATTANTATGAQLLGTIAYLAPELVTRGTADARSDIYALGIMLYEMLVGEQPYKGEQPMQIAFQHATDSVPRPSVKNPGVPEPLDELVLWATEKVPDDRPSDAAEMLNRLREIERELGVAPQVARTLTPSRRRVADDVRDSGELTRVLPPSVTAPIAAAEEVDNASRLRTVARRRAAKGGWLLALVLLLAVVAGGAGWYFGSGPGSMVSVAAVAGTPSFAEAEAALVAQGLTAQQRDVYSLDVAAGAVVGSDPGEGTRVDRGASVAVLVSQGPQPRDIPALAGLGSDQARTTLTGLGIVITDPDQQSFTDAEKGAVLSASVTPRGGADAIDCTNGCSVHEGDTASLSVSAGPLPDVGGKSVQDATAALQEVGLSVAGTYEEFNDDLDAGAVIYIAGRDGGGNWVPGESVTLAVSKGPEPVEVPSVVGLTRDAAKKKLSDLGFTYQYLATWDLFLDSATRVEAQVPAAGQLVRAGSEVSLRFQVSG